MKRDKLDKKTEPGVFIGYSDTFKAHRVFQPQYGKILITRDVVFMEDEKWDWSSKGQASVKLQPKENDVDDQPIRGTRPLADIYARRNVAVMEPIGI